MAVCIQLLTLQLILLQFNALLGYQGYSPAGQCTLPEHKQCLGMAQRTWQHFCSFYHLVLITRCLIYGVARTYACFIFLVGLSAAHNPTVAVSYPKINPLVSVLIQWPLINSTNPEPDLDTVPYPVKVGLVGHFKQKTSSQSYVFEGQLCSALCIY